MPEIRIGGRIVGDGHPPFIIAEAGINHNGDLAKAYRMVEMAKEIGADAVKFQTFKAEEFCGDPNQMFSYKSQGKKVSEPMLEMFKRYEFSPVQWKKIRRKCDEVGITFLSTPQNRSDLDLLLGIGIDAIKVGSDDFVNHPLLKDFSKEGLPMIVSMGMSDLGEVHRSLTVLGAFDGAPVVLLFCTSQYPTPPKDINMNRLRSLKEAFPRIPMGFSDHSQGSTAAIMAVAHGACVFEKHFTLDHDLPGPDHWFSEDPAGLRDWIAGIRRAHTMMGDSAVRPSPEEEKMKVLARRSIVAIRDIRTGERLGHANIGLRRPGNGLPPAFLESVLGMKASRNIKTGTLLRLGDFK